MDFNNDGVLDLILGERDGYFNFYTGNGDGTLHFIGRPKDNAGTPIKRAHNSAGYLDDWNGDGYLDFIAGGYDGASSSGGVLEVYLNTGESTTSLVWDANAIDLTSTVCDRWRLTHQTYDLDGDGDKDMILGSEMGNVWFAENTGTASNPVFNGYTQLVCDAGNIDVGDVFSGDGRARENVVDYNNDGIPDLLVGCDKGCIFYFQGYETGIEEGTAGCSEFEMVLSAVPTAGVFALNLTLPSAAPVDIRVFDSCGRTVDSRSMYSLAGFSSVQLDITDCPAGVYMVSVSVNGVTETARTIKTY